MCHGSGRCGADSVTVFIFTMMAVPYPALSQFSGRHGADSVSVFTIVAVPCFDLAYVMGPTGVVLTVSLFLSFR